MMNNLELHLSTKGRMITPRDSDYDAARTIFYGGIDLRPALIVRAANSADVVAVIRYARERGLELAVRSGGHSVAGHGSTEGGIVLDLREMKSLHIDTASRTAWAEPGLTARQYTAAADAHDLANGFGDTGSVGLGGLILGGGIGYLLRKQGLTIDSLLEAEVVTADGQILRVNAEHHPDLFWAMRGGGGNFGVATRFQLRLHPLGSVLGGMLALPATDAAIADFLAEALAAPDELTTIANIMPAPPMPFLPAEQVGKLVLMGMMVYAGDPEAGTRAVAPFRKLARPLADMLRPMRYPEIFPPGEEYHPLVASTTMFLDSFDRAAARTVCDYLENSDAPLRAVQLRALGGAMARVPADATAFAHRQSNIMASLAAFYTGEKDKALRQDWVDRLAAAIRQGAPRAYVNFLGDEGQAGIRAAYPQATYERLAQIKARYDPENFFHRNQNVLPLPAAGAP